MSSLSHPHICALYDIGETDGVSFLVMEYVEGETLASRLLRRPSPIDQVLATPSTSPTRSTMHIARGSCTGI